MEVMSVAQLKKALRKEHLKRLRAWATAEPAQLHAASQELCEHLGNYIQARYRPLAHPLPHRPTSDVQAPTIPLFIFAYLPLYYEADLVQLMRRLWPMTQEQQLHILAPVVLPSPPSRASCGAAAHPERPEDPSAPFAEPLSRAMAFVEVMDAADLESAFAPQGRFNIREFSSALLMRWLTGRGRDTTPTTRMQSIGQTEHARDCEAAKDDKGILKKDGRLRHVVLCDSYAKLFPAAHAAGYRPAGLLEYASECATATRRTHATASSVQASVPGVQRELDSGSGGAPLHLDDVSMLVLVPGVLFDVQTGRRMGKGCGYYDRFLGYHARHHLGTRPSSTEHPTAAQCEAVGATAQHSQSHESEQSTDVALPDAAHRGHAEQRHPRWEVVAVAFDAQVVRGGSSDLLKGAPSVAAAAAAELPLVIPVDEHDQPVHAVVSPSGGVEEVHESYL
ncbi:putative mitochondrial hypothetical protein [Leptomonas pyrrhocoris]|uniref:5-formyltetrahydrofolate cyclo-ligase n=1 Tax=Leptomonas pyrrhocoris TaxID=157538 RepID=A0A0M9G712_LEPPY|nr:putative mitochondrial hypothetical protein [Leptomonas pyrrhocoris]KPA83910.1 putative mitochondrial hypothetical protein [Leptomonas pyrrhocoris]|eukprot:XP_015662349.1 putative mitochondrial hypothetical protein [Leptomonas pyrrhocoris]